jgi:hypothetical protein
MMHIICRDEKPTQHYCQQGQAIDKTLYEFLKQYLKPVVLRGGGCCCEPDKPVVEGLSDL